MIKKSKTSIKCRYCNKNLSDLISHTCLEQREQAKWGHPFRGIGEKKVIPKITKNIKKLPLDTRRHYTLIKKKKNSTNTP